MKYLKLANKIYFIIMNQLYCPNCNAKLSANDINVMSNVGKCNNCNSAFQLSEAIALDYSPKPHVRMPKGIEAYHGLTGLDIELDWRKSSSSLGFFIFFTLFWDFVVGIFVVAALAGGDLGFLLPISIHLLVGIGMTYYVMALLLNKTYIYVSASEVSIEHRPLPWPFNRNKYLNPSEIEQFYVEEYVASTTNGRPNYAYRLLIKKKDGEKIKVLNNIGKLAHARYIEQEMEKFLHIEDEPMQGEYR